MKNFQKITPFILLTFLIAYPSKTDFSNAFIKVAKEGNPTVVSIISEKNIEHEYHNFFESFDNRLPKNRQKSHSLGSGVIIDSNQGYIITNNHVIENAEEIKVVLFDKREIKAEIIATDPPSDIAILKIESNKLTNVKMGNSEKLKVGEWVIAIGSPFGLHLNHTVTAGIISAKGRNDVISRNNFEDFIQHDAAINPGNSGGALFNLDGELVGINTAIATDGFSRANAGVGFAIPINMIKRIMVDLISDGKVTRGWLGVQIQDVNGNMAKALKLKDGKGALISQVIRNSPAENAGVKNQDVIISVDGKKIDDSSQLKNIISTGRPNDNTKLTIIRDGKKKNVIVELGTRPDQHELTEVYQHGNTSNFDLLGLIVKNNDENNQNNKKQSTNEKGIIVMKVQPDSVSDQNNILEGDIILEVGRNDIHNISDYNEELNKYESDDTIMLRILRNNNPFYLAFEIK